MSKDIINTQYDNQFMYHHTLDDELFLQTQKNLRHSHRHYEILQLLNGNIDFILNGKIYNLSSGDIIIVRRNDFHIIKTNHAIYERRVLEFEPSFFKTTPAVNEQLMSLFMHDDNFDGFIPSKSLEKSEINSLFEKIEACLYKNDELSQLFVMIYTMELLCEFRKIIPSKTAKYRFNPAVRAVINYVDENITQKINLPDLERAVNVTRFHLSRTFKSTMGITISQYIAERKILYAEQLIEKGMSPTEASEKIAYNYSNFFANYKKFLHKSPRQSKKDIRQ